jgi:hypothetical protein
MASACRSLTELQPLRRRRHALLTESRPSFAPFSDPMLCSAREIRPRPPALLLAICEATSAMAYDRIRFAISSWSGRSPRSSQHATRQSSSTRRSERARPRRQPESSAAADLMPNRDAQSRVHRTRAMDVRLETTKPPSLQEFIEWAVTGSNRRLPACKAGALPAELTARGCDGIPRWCRRMFARPMTGLRAGQHPAAVGPRADS